MSTPVVPGPDHYWPPQPTPAAAPRISRRRPILWWILGGVALIVAVAASFAVVGFLGHRIGTSDANRAAAAADASTIPGQGALESRLTRTKSACDAGDTGTRVADGGKTLIIDGAGKEDGGVGVDSGTLDCILVVLDMPESVKEHVYQTRALDGRQTDTWPGFSASWSYHPNSGVEMIVTAS